MVIDAAYAIRSVPDVVIDVAKLFLLWGINRDIRPSVMPTDISLRLWRSMFLIARPTPWSPLARNPFHIKLGLTLNQCFPF